MDPVPIPDACTLPVAEQPLRLAELDALLAGALRGLERRPGSVLLRLRGDASLPDRVRDLAARETACCSFFAFRIEGDADDLTVEISAPPERQDILDSLARRAGSSA